MKSNFKKNVQEALIKKIEEDDTIANLNPIEAYRKGFMDLFEMLHPDINDLTNGLNEMIYGNVFYSELPVFAKELLYKWNWDKLKVDDGRKDKTFT